MTSIDAQFFVASLLRRAVLPAVEAVLRNDEVRALGLSSTPPRGAREREVKPGQYWLVITIVDEPFTLCLEEEALQNVGWSGMQEHIADQLRTFVAESRFGWGQQR